MRRDFEKTSELLKKEKDEKMKALMLTLTKENAVSKDGAVLKVLVSNE